MRSCEQDVVSRSLPTVAVGFRNFVKMSVICSVKVLAGGKLEVHLSEVWHLPSQKVSLCKQSWQIMETLQ